MFSWFGFVDLLATDRWDIRHAKYRVFDVDRTPPAYTTVLGTGNLMRLRIPVTRQRDYVDVHIEAQVEDVFGNVTSLSRTLAALDPSADTTPPAASAWIVSYPTGTGFRLAWSPSSDNRMLGGYNLYVLDGETRSSKLNDALVTELSFTFEGLDHKGKFVELEAVDEAGNVSLRADNPSVKLRANFSGERNTRRLWPLA